MNSEVDYKIKERNLEMHQEILKFWKDIQEILEKAPGPYALKHLVFQSIKVEMIDILIRHFYICTENKTEKEKETIIPLNKRVLN